MTIASPTPDVRPLPYGQDTPPPALTALLRAARTTALYRPEDRGGDLADAVRQAHDVVAQLQRNAWPLLARDLTARRVCLLSALQAGAATPAERLQALGQMGDFRFRPDEPAADRRQQLAALAADTAPDDLVARAALLGRIWRPETHSFLDALLHRPSEAARQLARPATPAVVGHALDGLGGEGRQAFTRTGVVSWRDGETLHVVGGAAQYLASCGDAAAPAESRLSALHLLLLHDRVIAALRPSPRLQAPSRHLVADAFVACLTTLSLPLAVESFFVDWESRQAPVQRTAIAMAAVTGDAADADAWMECIISHDELRPEAFAEHTLAEQRQILKEMFGDDWDDEDEAALTAAQAAAA